VSGPRAKQDDGPGRYVLGCDGHLVLGAPWDRISWRGEPYCLLYGHRSEGETRDVIGVRRPAGKYFGDLAVDGRLHVGVATKQVHRDRQRRRRCVVPCQQEDQDLVAYLLRAQWRAGLRVPGGEQQRDQVLSDAAAPDRRSMMSSTVRYSSRWAWLL
jgi:hypothetical protein